MNSTRDRPGLIIPSRRRLVYEILRILAGGALLMECGSGLLCLRSSLIIFDQVSKRSKGDRHVRREFRRPEDDSPKQPTSPARNAIGLIVLVGVIAFGVYEYSAKAGFNKAVTALDARTQDDDKELATVSEAEALLGKEADGPATEFTEGSWNFSKKTYTWKGLLKNYTLTAYYTKEQDSRLHHFETEGQKYELTPPKTAEAPAPEPTVRPATKGAAGKGGNRGGGQPKAKSNSGTGSPGKSAAPNDKAAAPSDKAAAPSDKAAAPKSETKDTDAAPKSAPPGRWHPDQQPASGTESTPKPATDPAPAKPGLLYRGK